MSNQNDSSSNSRSGVQQSEQAPAFSWAEPGKGWGQPWPTREQQAKEPKPKEQP